MARIELTWTPANPETAISYEVRYALNSPNPSYLYVATFDTFISIPGLIDYETYIFGVRTFCEGEIWSEWTQKQVVGCGVVTDCFMEGYATVPDVISYVTVGEQTITNFNTHITIYGAINTVDIDWGDGTFGTSVPIDSFSHTVPDGTTVYFYGPIDIFKVDNTVPISQISSIGHSKLTKAYATFNGTLNEAHFDNNPKLWQLDLRGGIIDTFTGTNNPVLRDFFILYNRLTEIDMSTMQPTMYRVYINNNRLTWDGVTYSPNGFSNMLDISANPLGTLEFSEISSLGRLRAWGTGISTIDFTPVTNCSSIRIDSNNLTTFDTSLLTSLSDLRIENNPVTSFDFSTNTSFTTFQGMYLNLPNGYNLDFTNNSLIYGIVAYGDNLGDVTLPASNIVTTLRVQANRISTTNVNRLLQELDANGLSNGLCELQTQTPAAPPTGAGITAKANLIAKGWTVNTG